MPYPYAGPGVIPALKQLITNRVTLQSGEVQLLSPAGWYLVRPGLYTVPQQYDPITGIWWGIGGYAGPGGVMWIYSDGANYRLANQTGTVVGALLTNGGTGYSSPPTVTASAGNSLWKTLVGGAVNTTVTVSNGGVNYTYPPQVIFAAPPTINNGGGIPATGYSTISGGVVTSVTVTNQGAGYTSAPVITFVNDPRETSAPVPIPGSTITIGSGASAVCTLTGANTVTGVLALDHGAGGQTAVPTLTFAGGGGSSAAATAIMCWSITTISPSGGTAFGTSEVSAIDAFPVTASAYTNPDTQANLVRTRRASIKMLASSGVPTATGAVIYDGGIYTSAATPLVITSGVLVTASTTVTLTFGGQTDTSYVMTP